MKPEISRFFFIIVSNSVSPPKDISDLSKNSQWFSRCSKKSQYSAIIVKKEMTMEDDIFRLLTMMNDDNYNRDASFD
jgi:hypothetical protein